MLTAILSSLILPTLLTLAGGVFLILGVRGRRIDNHPVCRRCGFDLFRKAAESTRCAECGADISGPRAIRIGMRKMCWRVAAAALPTVLLCLSCELWCASQIEWGVEWEHHKPVWLLLRDAHGGQPLSRDAALGELARRIQEKTLPRQCEEALIDEAFKRQLDLATPWVTGWGTLVESCQRAGRLSKVQWGQYMLNGFHLTLQPVRNVARRWDNLSFKVRRGPDRFGSMKEAPDWFHVGVYVAGNYGEDHVNTSGHITGGDIAATGREYYSMRQDHGARGLDDVYDIVPGGQIGGKLSIDVDAEWPQGNARLTDGPQTTQITLIARPLWTHSDLPDDADSGPPPPPAKHMNLSASWTLVAKAKETGDRIVRD